MPERRSRFKVCLDVLETINQGTKMPTRIMYNVMLSYKTLTDVMKMLVDLNLVEEIDLDVKNEGKRNKRIYELTYKGKSVLDYFNQVEDVLGIPENTLII